MEAYPRAVAGRRFELRCALYKATLSATRHNPAIDTFYQRLLVVGKYKEGALIARMHKLPGILNAMANTRTTVNPDHVNA